MALVLFDLKHYLGKYIAAFIVAFSFTAFAQENQSVEVPTVIIDGSSSVNERPIDANARFKVEKVKREKLKKSDRQTLTEIVSDQVGVDAQVYCANCGAKRLTINGLKGEHTSILVDGIPIHSAISSFYGVDNIPSIGIKDIEVMRGTGASLTNPEAIGGTLNIVTVDPLEAENFYSTSIGVSDRFFGKSQNHQILYSLPTDKKEWGLVIGGQFSRQEAWDEDRNAISESPQRENYSIMLKGRQIIDENSNLTVRFAHSELEILGGFYDPSKPPGVTANSASELDFVDGRVDRLFVGDPNRVIDWVNVKRSELTVSSNHIFSQDLNLDLNFGMALQSQDSIYQHGFDYNNKDQILVGDAQFKYSLSADSILTFGAFVKDQRLRSESILFVAPRNLDSDNFDYRSIALYGQYSYFVGDSFEFDLALRSDWLSINWLDLTNEIDEWILAPRFQALHNITHHLTQRLSLGLGYRAPLTFFESQHGNNEGGYEIDITELEKSYSAVYSMSLNTPDYYITGGVHYTKLMNMAFGFEQFNVPIKYRNTDEDFDIWVYDLLLGYKPTDSWLLELSYEKFDYESGYKRKLPTAAIEDRFQFKATYEKGNWSSTTGLQVVLARDLGPYGAYPEHYIDRDQFNGMGEQRGDFLKDQSAPTYFTVHTDIAYKFKDWLELGFSIKNLFDFTQASEGDTPATWHWHFVHAHFDGLHTWGPNQGRQFLLTLSGNY